MAGTSIYDPTYQPSKEDAEFAALHSLFADLHPAEQLEFMQALEYIQERMATGTRIPEGSVAHVIAHCSPAVQEKFAAIDDLLETPRFMPFEPKSDEATVARMLLLDPAAAVMAKSQIDAHAVAANLQRKMGTDFDDDLPPPTLADDIAAAFEVETRKPEHAGQDDYERHARALGDEIDDLRDTTRCVVDAVENMDGNYQAESDDDSDMRSDILRALENS